MRLSISNIAWPAERDKEVYELLVENDFQGIDIAPGRVFENPYEVTTSEIQAFKSELSEYGLRIGGVQSLLYKRPNLTIFDSAEQRTDTLKALKQMIELGSKLEVPALVFGSPKNRIIGEVTEEKMEVAHDFFFELGEYALKQGTVFVLEPNPSIYGGDFLLGTSETLEFVKSVGSKGLKLNLDTGTIIVNKEIDEIPSLIQKDIDYIGHVHLSMPSLAPLEVNEVHKVVLEELEAAGYMDWVAIEMLGGDIKKSVLLKTIKSIESR